MNIAFTDFLLMFYVIINGRQQLSVKDGALHSIVEYVEHIL